MFSNSIHLNLNFLCATIDVMLYKTELANVRLFMSLFKIFYSYAMVY
jgi:hypothetical protein